MRCLESPCPPQQTAVGFNNLITHLLAAQCLLNEDWIEDKAGILSDGQKFDFVIVGAGTAGSLLAGRLSERKEWNILLIESGGDPTLDSVVPYWQPNLLHSDLVWEYYTEKDSTTNRGCINGVAYWPRGRLLGGSGSICEVVHMRGNERDYESWHLEEDDGWDWLSIRKYFKKSEKMRDPYILNNPKLLEEHGTHGEFDNDRLNSYPEQISEILVKAYSEIGLEYLDDLNGPTQLGFGVIRGGYYKGKRISTATAFLNKAKDRKNLFMLKNTNVTRVLIDNNVAKGVEVSLNNGKRKRFYATKEVILSAGSINTPILLMLSGVGPRSHLGELGIKIVADLPVGKNLQDHLRIPVPVLIDTGVPKTNDTFWAKEIANYLIDQTGPLGTNYRQPNVNAFFTVQQGNMKPDIQLDHAYFERQSPDIYDACINILTFEEDICKQLETFNVSKELIYFMVALANPFSRGEILLRSNKFGDNPKIYPKYLSDMRDVRTFVAGLKRIAQIVDSPTFKEAKAELVRVQHRYCDHTEFRSNEFWECLARLLTYNVYHPVGTAKMGKAGDPTAVVNNRLKVFNVKGLRVVDASVMPKITSANTNLPTMMIAERAADFIKEEY